MPTERAPIDAWTLAHVVLGGVYGLLGLSPGKALVASVAWEAAEQLVVDESPVNIVTDIAANMLGYAVVRRVRRSRR